MPQISKRLPRWLVKLVSGQVDQAVHGPVSSADRSVQQPAQSHPLAAELRKRPYQAVQNLSGRDSDLIELDRPVRGLAHQGGPPGPPAKSLSPREKERLARVPIYRTHLKPLDRNGCGLVVVFLRWLDDRNIGGDTTSDDAWRLYGEYCDDCGARPIRQHEFLRQLKLHCRCKRRWVREGGVPQRLRFYTLPGREKWSRRRI